MVTVKRYIGKFRKPLHWQGWKPFLRRVLLPALLAVSLFLFVRTSLLTQYTVVQTHSSIGILAGDRVLIDRTAYGFELPLQRAAGFPGFAPRDPVVGDMIAFRDEYGRMRIGCVLAVPEEQLRHEDNPDMLPYRKFLTTGGYAFSGQIVGRVICVSYSVDPDKLLGIRSERFFLSLPCDP